MNALTIRNLGFCYWQQEEKIFKDISLDVMKGEIICILGPSGCGKSTFCFCLCGIIPHLLDGCLEGRVLIFNRPVADMKLPEICTMAGIVFQNPDHQLFSPTVQDEVAFGPENLCLGTEEIGRRINESLAIVNLEMHRYSHPEILSGGEKQLVAIASVLALHPEIIILDESLSQIDRDGIERIKNTVLKLKNKGKTIIMVEHDIANLDIADRVFFMKDAALEEIKNKDRDKLVSLYKIR